MQDGANVCGWNTNFYNEDRKSLSSILPTFNGGIKGPFFPPSL